MIALFLRKFKLMNLEQLKKKHQELGEEIKKLEKKEEKKTWMAEEGDGYYNADSRGEVQLSFDYGDCADEFRYLTGNYFQTEEEAERYLERQKAIGRVTHAIYALQGNWKPNWKDNEEHRHHIFYHYFLKKFMHPETSDVKDGLSLPYIQSEEIAEKIIKDHEKDLRIIFEV